MKKEKTYQDIFRQYNLTEKKFIDYLKAAAVFISTYIINGTLSYVELKRIICRQRSVFNGSNDARYIQPSNFKSVEEFGQALNISEIELAALAAVSHQLSIGSSNAASVTTPFLKYITDLKLFQIVNPESRSIILKSAVKPDKAVSLDTFNIGFVASTRRNIPVSE